MLLEEVNKWLKSKPMPMAISEKTMSIYFESIIGKKKFNEIFGDILLDIYHLQVCMEGVLEDLDGQRDQKNREKRKENLKRVKTVGAPRQKARPRV